MAILSNINGKFAVESSGAIQLSGSAGTSGYVLKSNGTGSAASWVDPTTIIGGPYLPLSGGTLTGATATASGISFTVGGNLTGTTATFTGDVTVNGWIKGASNTNTLYSATSLGTLLQSPTNSGTGGNIYFRNANGTVFQTFSQVDGSATFTGVIHTTKNGGAVAAISTPRIRLRTDGVVEWGATYNAGTLTWDTNKAVVQAQSSNALHLGANANSNHLIINTSGNVGIGTTTPNEKLVIGTTSGTQNIEISNSFIQSFNRSGSPGYASLNFYASSYGFNVGNATFAGTVTFNDHTYHPDQVKSIFGTGSDAEIQFNGSHLFIDNTVGTTYLRNTATGGSGFIFRNSNIGDFEFDNEFAGNIKFNTSNVERMRINSSGNVGIGVVPNAVTAGNIRLDVGYVGCGITSRQNAELVLTSNADYVTATTTGRNAIMINLQNDGNFNILNAPSTTAGSALTFTSRFYINTSGNVGIGTTSLTEKLRVQGNSGSDLLVRFQPFTNNAQTKLYLSSVSSGDGGYFYDANNNQSGLFAYGDYTFYVGTSNISGSIGDPRMIIKQGGNVGIGTTSPDHKLQVNGSIKIANSNSRLVFGTAGGTDRRALEGNTAGTLLQIGEGYTDIALQGNVGIGTTSPSSLLHLESASSPTLRIVDTTNSVTLLAYAQNSDAHIGTYSSHDLIFDTNSTQRMRIRSGGYIGMNTSPSGFATLEIENIASTTYGLYVDYTDTNASYGAMKVILTGASTSPSYVDWWYGATQTGAVVTTGSSTQYLTSSDYRLKENIVPMSNAINRVKQLKPSRFNFIGHENTVDGLIAHEVAEVVPEAVNGEKDGLRDDGTPKYQGIDEGKLVPLLIGAIQELEARVKELENK